ncbi:MAG: HupE/UreJ family protein, partial [Pseudomonadota bacterium]
MTVRSTQVCLAAWTALALTTLGAPQAHDLGVAQATLTEAAEGRYSFRVTIGPGLAALIAAPVLPKRCQFVDGPAGRRIPRGVVFDFSCVDPPLTAADELALPWQREGAMITSEWADGTVVRRFFPRASSRIPVDLSVLQAGSASLLDAARRYTTLGIEHIAGGTDHLLFVLGLFLMVTGGIPLLKTITAFTVAHSITLALATLGVVHFSPAPVEAATALSIAFLAAEIVRHHRSGATTLGYRFPWGLAFIFGLLHGLGFAGALSELGLPQSEIPIALLFFNVGVEVGQLAFIILLVVVRVLLDRLSNHRSTRLDPALAYGIGALSMYWFLDRSAAIFVS